MDIPDLRSHFPQPKPPRQNSPLRYQNVFSSTDDQMEKTKRQNPSASISADMAANMFTFALPTQLSPLSNVSHTNSSPQFLSTSQYASPAGQSASFGFSFPQITDQAPLTGPFTLRQFPQQQLMQPYHHDFAIQGYQQQQQQQPQFYQQLFSSDLKQPVPERQPRILNPPRDHPYREEQQRLPLKGQKGQIKDQLLIDQLDSHLCEGSSPGLGEPSTKKQKQDQQIGLGTQEPEEPTAIFSRRPHDPWILRGSCACCHVQYEVFASPSELPLRACYCHCAICRNLSGSNYIAFSSIPSDRIRWYCGQWDWHSGRGLEITVEVTAARETFEFGKTPGFTTAADALRLWSSSRKAVRGSCMKCGSVLFISYHSGLATTDIALGTLWDMEERGAQLVKPVMHIMLREKALWEHVPDDGLARYDGMPADGPKKSPPATRSKETPVRNIQHLLKCMLVY